MQGLILVLAAVLPQVFNLFATAIPLLLPRIGVTLRGIRRPAAVPATVSPAEAEDEDDED